jgi:tryptophanyl-tRNA synthetase
MAYIAAGVDPKSVVIFKQSDVPAHTELCWIFDTLTSFPYLSQGHAFKAAIDRYAVLNPHDISLKAKISRAKQADISVGSFNYPMLMAADILLYDAAVVPVGQDQKQHIEIARDTAEKFNRVYKSEVFMLPEPHIMAEVAVVPGTDGRKMSKSYGNVIPLFSTRDELVKAVMSIVTDSSGELPTNVYAIHKLVRSESELKAIYEEHAGKYKVLKEMLIEDLDRYLAPMRAKYEELQDNPSIVDDVLATGRIEARAVSEAKMGQVRKAIGVAD